MKPVKSIGPIAPNWTTRWSYLLSAAHVHTVTHCSFTENNWAPHLKCPVLDFYDYFCLGSCWDCCNSKLYYEKKHTHTVSAICLTKRPP